MERHLVPSKLVDTGEMLRDWIADEFKGSNLTEVADEVVKVTREATVRAARIRRPMYGLRLVVAILLGASALAVGYHAYYRPKELLQFIDETKGVGVYVMAVVAFLVGLEIRLKRRKALRAVHELQALSHVIDMHQLAKDSVIETFRGRKDSLGNYVFEQKIEAYLHACTALLALVSKIGQLYVEHFPDSVATRAVNEFELTATGLSGKIWQKVHLIRKAS